MLNPETLVQVYRRVKSRKLKVLGLESMRMLGMRHMVIRMDTINLCNLRCKMCYYSSDYNRKKDEMDLLLFRKIADQLFPKVRFLYLSCATEPLMNKHFADLVRATGEYHVPFTSFCTNGLLMTKEVAQACVESQISEIIFSIDGATAETYEHIRRGGKWSRLLEKMDLLAEIKRQAGSQYPQIRINFTCMARNIKELPAMVHFAADRGAQSLHVRHLLAYSDEENSCNDEMTYLRVFNPVAEEARKEAKARGIYLFLPDPISERIPVSTGKTCVTDARTVSRSHKQELNPYCMLPWFQGIISWAGDYRVCSTHTIGNLKESTFDQIYNGPKLKEIRRRMLWKQKESCSWDCREEAYDVPEQAEQAAETELIGIAPAGEQ